jgi:LysM repeat protein
MGLHRVERGDTWSGIAVRYRVSARALGEANPDVDPDLIRIGQTLLIPTAAATTRARSHRVGPGDTLSSIARRYGVPAGEIRRLNDMRNEVVRLGQTLVIPPAEATDPPGR